jgi:hypothetical protein
VDIDKVLQHLSANPEQAGIAALVVLLIAVGLIRKTFKIVVGIAILAAIYYYLYTQHPDLIPFGNKLPELGELVDLPTLPKLPGQ